MRNTGRCLVALCALFFIAGFSWYGGSRPQGYSRRASFEVSAQFLPDLGPGAPRNIGSLKIIVQNGENTPLGPFLLTRNDEGPWVIEGVTPGKTYVVTIEGREGTDGWGAKVATATLERKAVKGALSIHIDTIDTKTAKVILAPREVELKADQSQCFTIEARNSDGATLLQDWPNSRIAASLTPKVGVFDRATNTYTAPSSLDAKVPQVRLDVSIAGRAASAIIKFRP